MTTIRNLAALAFHAPPASQGQIVEVAYALDGDRIVRRVTDRSDRSVTYATAPNPGDVEPWNEGPGALDWTEARA